MFALTDVRYIEGAPIEWRQVLTPGTAVVLYFEEPGLTIAAGDIRFNVPWDRVQSLAARGPDVPEQRYDDSWAGILLRGGLLDTLIKLSRPYESYCWLAIEPVHGDELIFEVEQMLRPELERTLEAHSG